MEVSNIEGSFRTTCEHVMRLLRDNKESLMAVLEAFVHDPLLTWRLNTRDSPPEPSFPSERRTSIMGTGAMAPQPSDAVSGRRGSVMGGTAAASASTDPHEQRPSSSYRPPQRNRLSSAAPPNAGGHHGAAATGDPVEKEVQNARALQVLSRVKEKLTGRDFKKTTELPVEEQVEKLLSEATNLENLCQHYIGWCSFW
ncbi:phosphatidylinositol kinase-related protein kinase tor1 [Friedmanniomyces endolithicus]|nr:phosphatidylinositol kinase-related protein kinase tor1 [Friedmanniomyces endolithicus]